MHISLSASIAVLAATTCIPAQAAWTQLNFSTSVNAGAVGVSDGSALLIFGGRQPNGTLSDFLSRCDGLGWGPVITTGAKPSPREFAAAAWDSNRQRLVLFGGLDASGVRNDTWEWDGRQWSMLPTAHTPSARRWASLAYDANLHCCVLFGGENGIGNYSNELWTWDGVDWTHVTPPHTPTRRARGNFAYDPVRSEMLYFGGRDAMGVIGETWKWDNADWVQVTTSTVPGGTGLYGYSVAYDVVRDRYVVFGGTSNGTPLANTWEFDGVDWTNRGNVGGVPAQTDACFAFVDTIGKGLLSGSASSRDTWLYGSDQIASFRLAGAGCLGAGGVPRLGCPQLPWIGDRLTLDVRNTAATASTFIAFGFAPVSISLAPIGAPNCVVQADPLATGATAIDPVSGLPSFSLGVPMSTNLIGRSMYVQALVLDALGVAVSSRGDLVFGAR